MIKAYLKPFNSPDFYNNAVFKINNGHNIFYNVKPKLLDDGIQINTIDLDENDGDTYIFCDLPYPWEISNWKKILFGNKRKVLFIFESPIVNPFNHFKFLYRFFERVYTWDNSADENEKVKLFRIPQVNPKKVYSKAFNKKRKFISLINSNKLSPLPFKLLSPYKFDGYSERASAIEYLEERYPKDFHLYGKNWNSARKFSLHDKLFGYRKFDSYKGTPENKYEVLDDTKFCICYENAIAPGYFTEKIFDCFISGCVPIYLGATNIEDFIPKESYIDKNDFGSYAELCNYLDSISEAEYQKYIAAGKNFIEKDETKKRYFEENFYSILVDSIRP